MPVGSYGQADNIVRKTETEVRGKKAGAVQTGSRSSRRVIRRAVPLSANDVAGICPTNGRESVVNGDRNIVDVDRAATTD